MVLGERKAGGGKGIIEWVGSVLGRPYMLPVMLESISVLGTAASRAFRSHVSQHFAVGSVRHSVGALGRPNYAETKTWVESRMQLLNMGQTPDRSMLLAGWLLMAATYLLPHDPFVPSTPCSRGLWMDHLTPHLSLSHPESVVP